MTREEAIIKLIEIRAQLEVILSMYGLEISEVFDMAIKALKEQIKFDRLYNWLNDMRFGIAPDETTPDDERGERQAQVDVLDMIMEWMVEQHESVVI